jgi:two-component system nitrate/nitrite response regulator NarL
MRRLARRPYGNGTICQKASTAWPDLPITEPAAPLVKITFDSCIVVRIINASLVCCPFALQFNGAWMLQSKPPLGSRADGGVFARDTVDPPSALIVSDTRLLRDGLRALLLATTCCVVVGATRASAAADAVRNLQPDMILLDASALTSPSFAKGLRQAAPVAKVIVFGLSAVDRNIIASADIGISGFVGRDGSAQELVGAIEQTWRGHFAATPEVTSVLIDGLASLSRLGQQDLPSGDLTPRQRQIVPLLEQGLSNKEIARLLGIEVATIKNHVHGILGRMQLCRRGQIASHRRAP